MHPLPPLPTTATLTSCSLCKRKILIEQILIGVNHTTQIVANCWDCLQTHDGCKKAYQLYPYLKPKSDINEQK